MVVGAVWRRILCNDLKGFSNIDNKTPKFAISIYRQYRKKGIDTVLMKVMILLLNEKGYEKVSLAVQKYNYAVRVYTSIGFKVAKELEEDF